MPNRARPQSARGSDARWEPSREAFNPWMTEYRQMYVDSTGKKKGGAGRGRAPRAGAGPRPQSASGVGAESRRSAWARERQSSHAFDEDRKAGDMERYLEDQDVQARVLRDMDDEARAAFMKAKAEQRERQLRRRFLEQRMEEQRKGTPSYLRRGPPIPLRSTQKWLESRGKARQPEGSARDGVAPSPSGGDAGTRPPFHNYGRNHVSPHRDLGEMHLTFNVKPAQAPSKAPTPQVHAHAKVEYVRRHVERTGGDLAEDLPGLPERRPVEKLGKKYVMRRPYTPPHELVTPRSEAASTSARSEASAVRPPWGYGRRPGSVARKGGGLAVSSSLPPWEAQKQPKQQQPPPPDYPEAPEDEAGSPGRVRLMDADLDELAAIDEDDEDIFVDDEESLDSDAEQPRAKSPTPTRDPADRPAAQILKVGSPSPRLYPGTSPRGQTSPRPTPTSPGRAPWSPAGIAPVMPAKLEDAFPKKGEDVLKAERKIDGIPAGDRRRQLTPRGHVSVVGTPRDDASSGVGELDADAFGIHTFTHPERRHTPREGVPASVRAAHVPQGRTVPNRVRPGRPPRTPHSPDMPVAGTATKMSQPVTFDHPDF